MAITLPDPGPPNLEFEQPADRARLERTVAALQNRGFIAHIADGRDHARQLVLAEIPQGAEVHVALSETLRELGIMSEIDESGRYESVRARLSQLDRATQGREMAKLGAAPHLHPRQRPRDHGRRPDHRRFGIRQPARRLRVCRRPRDPRRWSPEARR